MNMRKVKLGKVLLASLALAGAVQSSQSQVFNYQIADLCLGVRNVESNDDADNDEVVVDIGQASNYVAMAIGSTITLPNVSSSQLSGSFVSFANLQWSVTGYFVGNAYPGYPTETLWLSVARPSAGVQSAALIREATSSQQTIKPNIDGILSGAVAISKTLVTSNQFNTPHLVRESLNYSPTGGYPNNQYEDLDYYIDDTSLVGPGSPGNSGFADLRSTWDQGSLEATNPPSFTGGSEYLDLYEVRPLTDSHGNPIVDPHTGTNSTSYYLGYFTFTSGGSLSFTRAASSTGSQPPPAPTLSISLPSGFILGSSKLTISFATTNGPTYTLHATNSAGLKSSVGTWPTLGTVTGNGSIQSFQDTISISNRFYAVTVH